MDFDLSKRIDNAKKKFEEHNSKLNAPMLSDDEKIYWENYIVDSVEKLGLEYDECWGTPIKIHVTFSPSFLYKDDMINSKRIDALIKWCAGNGILVENHYNVIMRLYLPHTVSDMKHKGYKITLKEGTTNVVKSIER